VVGKGGRIGEGVGKVAVARKPAVLLHHLWKTGEVYDPLHLAKKRGEPVPA
jgi:transposase